MTLFYEKLLEVLDSSHVKTEEKMSRHTTFRAGGPAAFYVSPADARELGEVIRLCRREEVPYCILGNGSRPGSQALNLQPEFPARWAEPS